MSPRAAAMLRAASADGDPLSTVDLHPLDLPPQGPAWNLDELDDLLPPALPRKPAAVLIGIVPRADGARVLLTRRTEGLSTHAGQISFPGGRIEPDDGGPLIAALRETAEEVAIAADRLHPLGFLDPYDTISGFRVTPLVARLDPAYRAVPDPREVAEAFEVPLAFLLDPANCERHNADYRGRMRHYYQFRFGAYRIWGATAAMLVDLRRRLDQRRPSC
ncbi:MAG: CoA pyrophosphatase [Lysobacteraceae bacterium]